MICKSFKARCPYTQNNPFISDCESTSKQTGVNCNEMLKRMDLQLDLNSCCLIVIDYLNGQCEININIYNNIDLRTIWYLLSVGNGQNINACMEMNMNQECNNHPCTFYTLLKSVVVLLIMLILQWLILLIKIGYFVNGV